MRRDACFQKIFQRLQLPMETNAVVSSQLFKILFTTAFDTHPNMQVLDASKICCIGGIVSEENAVGLQNEEVLFGDERQNLK